MRRYRLLIYDGDEKWIETSTRHEFIQQGKPYICGKGSVHSMELKPLAQLKPNDLLRSGMGLIEALADEQVMWERAKAEENEKESC